MRYSERYCRVDKEACRDKKSILINKDGPFCVSRLPYRLKVNLVPRGRDQ